MPVKIVIDVFTICNQGSRKKSGKSTKAFSPPPPRLNGQKKGYKLKKKTLKKSLFLVDKPLPPTPFRIPLCRIDFSAAWHGYCQNRSELAYGPQINVIIF